MSLSKELTTSSHQKQQPTIDVDLTKAQLIRNTTPYRKYLCQPRAFICGKTGKRVQLDPADTFFCTETGINLVFTGEKIIFLFPFKVYSPGLSKDIVDYLQQLVSSVHKTGYLGLESMQDIDHFNDNKWKRITELYPLLDDAYEYFIKRNVVLYKWEEIKAAKVSGDLDYRFICNELEPVLLMDGERNERWTVAKEETTLKTIHDFFKNEPQRDKTMADYEHLMKTLHLQNNYKKWCISDFID